MLKNKRGGRINFNTTLDKDLLEKLRIQAVLEKRRLNDILEELIKKYLEEKGQSK